MQIHTTETYQMLWFYSFFLIFKMKKLFSIVSPPTFHLAPRSLQISYQAVYFFNFSLQFVSDFFLDVGKEFCLPDLSNVVDSERFWGGSHFCCGAQKSCPVAMIPRLSKLSEVQVFIGHVPCWNDVCWNDVYQLAIFFVVKISVSFSGVCNS